MNTTHIELSISLKKSSLLIIGNAWYISSYEAQNFVSEDRHIVIYPRQGRCYCKTVFWKGGGSD